MRVLVLTSNTGGAHNMRAAAFQEWALACPEFGLSIARHRPLELSHPVYAFGVGLYNWIQRTAPALHHIYYNFLEAVPIVHAAKPLGAPRFRDVLEETRPDVLLSVHDSLNHVFFEYARTVLGPDNVRCVTYCDELAGGYGFSRHWVNPRADLFIGAVPETCAAAVRWGMAAEKTRLGGFMLRRCFDNTARAEPQEFTLLLCASSRGANNHLRFLEALQKHHLDIPVVCLCGQSPAAQQGVTAWAQQHPAARVRVVPHDADIGALMRSVSAVVARPGAGATSEAIASGCPLLLNCLGGIMPQELITVKFCRKHGVAQTIHRPDELAQVVAAWIRQPERPAEIRQRMKTACPVGHPRDILRMVAALGVKSGSTAAKAIPVIEAARAARPVGPVSPETIRPR